MLKKIKKVETTVNGVNKLVKPCFTNDILPSTFVKALESVNEAVGPFVPLVTMITTLTKELAKAYENVQYNKKTCGILVNRVEAAEVAIKGLMRQKEEYIEQFLNQDYYESFERFVICLEKIKEFFYEISQLSKVEKFFTSSNIKEDFQNIIKEFDSCSNDLNLAISITTNEQMNKYLTIIHSDMIEVKKFLDNVEGGITSIDNNINEIICKINNIENQNNKIIEQNNKILEYGDKSKSLNFTPLNKEINNIYSLNEQVNNNQNFKLEAKRIESSELKDSSQFVIRKGTRVTIQKKVYQAMDVACKPIMNDVESIQKYLAILEKLKICPHIIQFYGLSEMYEKKMMIFEWAEYGTLRELYIKFDNKITWEAKISIARDICRGLAFLHSVNILHHDLRCENILIAEKMHPKISNFYFSREFNDATHPIDNINDMIHWLAPEKLRCISTEQNSEDNEYQEERYTIQCEIFSFGMLLWELCFQRKPYEDMTMTEIQRHVLDGNRETLDDGSCSNPIQEEYYSIIKLAWEQEPSLRPGIHHLFNMLQKSYENHINKYSLFHPTIMNMNFDIDNPSIAPLTPFNEGLRANRAHNYEKAWKCFEEHANAGKILAKYWQGRYYFEGKFVEKNFMKAKELFKEAADGKNADAQLYYAFCLISKNENNDYDNILKYLKMSAKQNNAIALYSLGKLYFYGKKNINPDKNKGIHYLKRAALRHHSKAEEFLRENNISICKF
ncbi:kinase-like domain-containing protein [Glomus cerebriforme]|uniref:Kinase-like domain-containing protein n=1 Tax=Glomus cerebriforme TaxID=658196 RepID=A0A397SWT4_9GLOM|nr:kinase-like domain-containing protein [Glomus cerebriforme]